MVSRKYAFHVNSVGQHSSLWQCNSVTVDIKSTSRASSVFLVQKNRLETKYIEQTYPYVSSRTKYWVLGYTSTFSEREDELWKQPWISAVSAEIESFYRQWVLLFTITYQMTVIRTTKNTGEPTTRKLFFRRDGNKETVHGNMSYIRLSSLWQEFQRNNVNWVDAAHGYSSCFTFMGNTRSTLV